MEAAPKDAGRARGSNEPRDQMILPGFPGNGPAGKNGASGNVEAFPEARLLSAGAQSPALPAGPSTPVALPSVRYSASGSACTASSSRCTPSAPPIRTPRRQALQYVATRFVSYRRAQSTMRRACSSGGSSSIP